MDFTAKLKRDVALHQVAQTLADAVLVRAGLRPQKLKDLPLEDRVWMRQTVEQLIAIYDVVMEIPTSVDAAAAERRREDQQKRALEDEVINMRSRASLAARARGHELSLWSPGPAGVADETATCVACHRLAHLVVVATAPPRVEGAGTALSEGCLVGVEREEVR